MNVEAKKHCISCKPTNFAVKTIEITKLAPRSEKTSLLGDSK